MLIDSAYCARSCSWKAGTTHKLPVFVRLSSQATLLLHRDLSGTCCCAGKLFLGGKLASSQPLDLNPLTLAGWAGLVVNALNMIPLGELDGGRVSFALWGRRAATRIGVVSTLLLGLTGILDELALYWVLLVLFLQRGPIVPQANELSEPHAELLPFAVGLLFLPLLVLIPLPFSLVSVPSLGVGF